MTHHRHELPLFEGQIINFTPGFAVKMPDQFALQLTRDLDPADLRHVLAVFETDLARLVGLLHDATEAPDAVKFCRVAHQLAGAAGAVGATALEDAARLAMDNDRVTPAGMEMSGAALAALARDAIARSRAFVAKLP